MPSNAMGSGWGEILLIQRLRRLRSERCGRYHPPDIRRLDHSEQKRQQIRLGATWRNKAASLSKGGDIVLQVIDCGILTVNIIPTGLHT